MHRLIPKNKKGRDFVVGDIHGQYERLMKRLDHQEFDKSRDRLFSLGDIIDRGPDSIKCLELVNEPWFYMVLGNHEVMMINAWLNKGQSEKWKAKHGRWARKLDEDASFAWAKRLQNLPLVITVKNKRFKVGICHAEPKGRNWKKMVTDEEKRDSFIWSSFKTPTGI